ncbi:hypothetical protein SDC9_48512 [bioreactor metagenome]|uniref:Uncharacterized protein n=1 Tax=bioreactor metagenome TaxID=1076179 RepID=A0A644WFE2_9ZZZZ
MKTNVIFTVLVHSILFFAYVFILIYAIMVFMVISQEFYLRFSTIKCPIEQLILRKRKPLAFSVQLKIK